MKARLDADWLVPAAAAWAGAALLLAGCARAPMGYYAGPRPAPGAITAFDSLPATTPFKEAKAGAPPFLIPGTTDRSQHRIGTLAVSGYEDSVVVLYYGDNRPGWRMMTAGWGLPIVLGIGTPDPLYFLLAIANIPVAAVQAVFPKLDLFQDLWALLYTHRFSGGAEDRVLRAVERVQPIHFIVNTGDLVESGRRGKLWERFVNKYARLRQRVPYLAAPGNHERTYSPVGRFNWDAAMGAPADTMRYWFAVDFPHDIARFIFLDTNVLADPTEHYPDSLETVISNEQIAWADSALSVPARYKFVVMHHPLVTSGHYLSDWKYDDSKASETRRRGRLIQICRRRGVTAVLAGHEHLYQRIFVRGRDGRGFWHLGTGGAGAPLYEVSSVQRKSALAVTLPDSSVVTWSKEKSWYHYCRVVIYPKRKPGEEAVVLEVHRVLKNSNDVVYERVDLSTPPPEEKRVPAPAASAQAPANTR